VERKARAQRVIRSRAISPTFAHVGRGSAGALYQVASHILSRREVTRLPISEIVCKALRMRRDS
jgi:hypothetical protein